MKHREPGIRQFAHLAVRDLLHLDRLFHDARIADEHAVDVREVLVDLGVHRGCENCTGDVGAASWERHHSTRLGIAEETRKHCDAALAAEMCAQAAVRGLQYPRIAGLVRQEQAGVARTDVMCLMTEFGQVRGKHTRTVVFAGGLQVVEVRLFVARIRFDARDEIGSDRTDEVRRQLQRLDDRPIALDHGFQSRGHVDAGQTRAGKRDQEVGDFGVARAALSRSRHHDDLSRGIGQHDVGNLAQLRCGCHRATAELDDFHNEFPAGRKRALNMIKFARRPRLLPPQAQLRALPVCRHHRRAPYRACRRRGRQRAARPSR